MEEAQSGYLGICVMHDYKVLADTRTKCVEVPEDIRWRSDSRVLTVTSRLGIGSRLGGTT